MNDHKLAAGLRAGFRAMIVEADEWRPLGAHVAALIEQAVTAERRRILPICEGIADDISAMPQTAGWMTRCFDVMETRLRNAQAPNDAEGPNPRRLPKRTRLARPITDAGRKP